MSQEIAEMLGAATCEKELKWLFQNKSCQAKIFAYSSPLRFLLHLA